MSLAQFNHEKPHCYQKAIEFVSWVGPIIEEIPKGLAARNQLERASTSIVLNIAEGNGKTRDLDRSHFFEIANGSALECSACLDVLVARKVLTRAAIQPGKEKLGDVVNLVMGMIRSHAPERLAVGEAQ